MLFNAIPNEEAIPVLMRNTRRITDGAGLHLIRGKTCERPYWRLDYSIHGIRKTLSLGVFPDTGIHQARGLADEFRAMVESGVDPSNWRKALGRTSAERLKAEALFKGKVLAKDSFERVALRWFAIKSKEWSPEYASVVQGRMKNHLFPILGRHRVASIGSELIANLCLDIQEAGAVETGIRVFKICKHICSFAVVHQLIRLNPCNDILATLAMPVTRNFAAIIEPEKLSELLIKIRHYQGTSLVKAALELKAMLMVRGIELRKAEWREFDLKLCEWRIPAIRMKGRLDRKINGAHHTVALPTQAVDILQTLFRSRGKSRSKYVFPAIGNPEKCISENTLNKALRIMGYSTKSEMTAHGFRATARTLIVEKLGWSEAIAELQLAHTVRDKNGTAYNRVKHLKKRKKMLQAWANYLDDLREGRFQPARDLDAFKPITETECEVSDLAGVHPLDASAPMSAEQIWVPNKQRKRLLQSAVLVTPASEPAFPRQ